MSIPAVVECPECGRMVSSVRKRFSTHSEFPTGPTCIMSRELITERVIADTMHIKRMEKVLLWAHILRDEDPRQVHTWMTRASREEMELLLLTALAAIQPDQTVREAFSWVKELSRT